MLFRYFVFNIGNENMGWHSIHKSSIRLGEGDDKIKVIYAREPNEHAYAHGVTDSTIDFDHGDNQLQIDMAVNAYNAIRGIGDTAVSAGDGDDRIAINIWNQRFTEHGKSIGIENSTINLGDGRNGIIVINEESNNTAPAIGIQNTNITGGAGKDLMSIATTFKGIEKFRGNDEAWSI